MSALQGVRVLDFGRFVAGPYCATILAEFGADVIRVEPPGGGEDRYLAPVLDTGEGALFLQVSRNKRSLTLDFASPRGRAIARQLIATADVVLTNVPGQALARMGLDYATLKEIKEDIIAVNSSAFGDTGPWAGLPGFDSVGQVMSGAAYMSGSPDAPSRAQVNWVDYSTAVHAALGAVMALYARNRTGLGQEVTTSLLATAVSFQGPLLIDEMQLGLDRAPLGNRGFASGPTDLFRAADGWIVCHVVSNPIFRRWARLMDRADLLDDPRFADDKMRGENGAYLSKTMSDWCKTRNRDEALRLLADAKVPAAPVLSPREVIVHPQVEALGLLKPISYRGNDDRLKISPVPITMSQTPGELRRGPPTPGEHSREILLELGFSDEEVDALEADAVT